MKMLYISLFCGVLSVVSARTHQDVVVLDLKFINTVRQIINTCQDETHPPPNVFPKLLDGILENEASVDFTYCYLTRAGYMEDDGHFNINKLLTLLKEDYPTEEYIKAFEACNKINGKDQRETVRLMTKCYKENSPVLFAVPS